MKAYERLLSYVKVFTPSSEETGTSPSTQYQFDLARLLVQELKELGVKDADVDEHCYVYGHIPATRGYESRQKPNIYVRFFKMRKTDIRLRYFPRWIMRFLFLPEINFGQTKKSLRLLQKDMTCLLRMKSK